MPNKSKEYKTVSAIILAAGNSVRMGSPKFMLQFDETHTFLEKIVKGYQEFGCKEIKIVLNSGGFDILKLKGSKIIDFKQIVINPNPEKERLLSIQIGLRALKAPELVFIHPVDNPFVDLNVLHLLVNSCMNGDYQIPTYQGKGGHPILIMKKLTAYICALTKLDQNFKAYISRFARKDVVVNSQNVLCNINTNSEYLDFKRQL